MASLPWRARMFATRISISSKASFHEIASQPPAVRRSGVRSRSGSSCRSLRATALGQMWPRLRTSSRLGLIESTAPSRCSTTMPHIASQRQQVRRCRLELVMRRRLRCAGSTGAAPIQPQAAEQREYDETHAATTAVLVALLLAALGIAIHGVARRAVTPQRAIAAVARASGEAVEDAVGLLDHAAAGTRAVLRFEIVQRREVAARAVNRKERTECACRAGGNFATTGGRAVQLAVGAAREFRDWPGTVGVAEPEHDAKR